MDRSRRKARWFVLALTCESLPARLFPSSSETCVVDRQGDGKPETTCAVRCTHATGATITSYTEMSNLDI
jgi:hypothetical protein